MKSNSEKRHNAIGLAFLLCFTLIGAIGNNLNTTMQTQVAPEKNALIPLLFWIAIILLYLPVYFFLFHSSRQWNWSLDEWGFGLSKHSWFGIGAAILILLWVWLPIPGILEGETGDLGLSRILIETYTRMGEELLYRGFALVLFRRIFAKSRFKSGWAVILSSLLFALGHTHFQPSAILNLFLGGAIPLATLTILTRSISFALVIHAIAGGGPVAGVYAALFFAVIAWLNRKNLRSIGDTS